MPASNFREFVYERGVTNLHKLISYNLVRQLESGKMPSNHPHRPVIARKLGITPEELAPFCNGKPLPDGSVSRLVKRMTHDKQRKSGTAVVLHPTMSSKAKGKRNSLKRQSINLREAVRGMLTTTNVAVMRGEKYVANMPTEALFLVLNDYAQRRGIKNAVVLDPQFASLFD